MLREICDFIARHATSKFKVEGNLDTLERTGPGVWTDLVLKHALTHPPSSQVSSSLAGSVSASIADSATGLVLAAAVPCRPRKWA